ncbi:ionotropic receptor 21a [Pectinophora gossypiella]|uniref:ionotropic receptor 21a n=1 Tax=Pectinophora gossypiella TaxID=13191 RepID=UPI00214E49EE|nr:ionotropic receptor 21a [Pectinophora gossypiella]
MKALLIFALIIITYHVISAELIEYYPSQNTLDNINGKINNKINKREIKSAESAKTDTDIMEANYKWRRFNKGILTDESPVKGHEKQIQNASEASKVVPSKRSVDPVFHGHPKTREELWNEHFLNESSAFDQTPSLIKLIHNITLTYLTDCTPVILYDYQVKSKEDYMFQNLLKGFPVTFVHGYIDDNYRVAEPKLLHPVRECLHYIVFITEVKKSAIVLGKQSDCKIVLIARSSQWAVQEFLAGPQSRMFINLLVIGQSFKEDDDNTLESPYILYTHKLYTDGLGSSMPIVLNSWTHGKFSRDVNLFPPKMISGYAGHRFVVSAANQPPFVVRRVKTDADGGNPRVTWDGIEIRLLKLLADRNNFSFEIVEPQEPTLGPGDAVVKEIAHGRADIGIAGMYMTYERFRDMDVTYAHSQDCAVFITLMSTALPRYRAILGPFHWHVWVALTFTYLFAIFPLAFSDKHTLRHLLHNSGEVENMFWYVFGTFTNCFTFLGKNSWSKTTKITTRLLIGWYWIFTIIITSCYTGSIIAFVTLPVFPETVDTIQQLLKGFYRIGTLDRGGWERWFFNSSDFLTNKLLNKLELVPNVEAGIRNTTKAFFWPYAFLGSQAELEYIVQANFTATKKRAVLHISNECFVPFGVIMGFPNNSLYTAKLNSDIMRMSQSGLVDKFVDEVRWEIQRSSTGKLLAVVPGVLKTVSVEEKGLTLEDTQGMFLLLAAGFLLAATALLSEWMGGFTRRCRQLRKKVNTPASANSRENLITTPKSDIDDEMKLATDETDSRLNFKTRSSTAESRDTLDGEIINVTEERIIVHNNLDYDDWDSRRSSSVDVDREVREIFEKDQSRRRFVTEEVIELSEEKREETASTGAFGDHLK